MRSAYQGDGSVNGASHDSELPRKVSGIANACVWQAGVQVWEGNQENGLKVSRKHSQTPRFSLLLHLCRQLSLPHPARIPEDFYSMEKLSGSTFRMPGPEEVGEMCMERRV